MSVSSAKRIGSPNAAMSALTRLTSSINASIVFSAAVSSAILVTSPFCSKVKALNETRIASTVAKSAMRKGSGNPSIRTMIF